MPFIEQTAKSEFQTINGKKTRVITPEVEITLTNMETGKEYFSDKEADDDVNDNATSTKREHIRRDVHIKVASIDLGAGSKEL
jgi:hypothetical protein|tara:strand:+ start:1143 stop:1391 length:249 start_codon:yes stop_codon:yes gene_type:complete